MQDILSALPAFLDQHSDNEDVRRAVVFAIWRRVSGDGLRCHAIPVELAGTSLRVAVADRSWQRNLEQLAPEMIFRMNFILCDQRVRSIEFVIAPAELDQGAGSVRGRAESEAAALDQINEQIRKAADAITDDHLRRKFLLAAGSCLAREERMATK
jgi:hypothetical protein